ncbi:MAG: ATP-binding cassette domain-containing protein [Bacteriovoracia bacterium]
MQKHDKDSIEIRGARVHNLKNIDLNIPLRKLVCFAGPSGSGKTSLAFHTLLTESKRRFVNSFPNSMKFFTERPAAVDVDHIFPVLPVFGLPQINPVVGSRSVVADIMRLTDSLQNLYFSFARELCPTHEVELETRSLSEQLKVQAPNNKEGVFYILLGPNEFQRVNGEDFLPARSFSQSRKTVEPFNPEDELWELLRFKWDNLSNIEKRWKELKLDHFQINFFLWGGDMKKPQKLDFHFEKVCPECDFESIPATTVSAFSPYSALGACPACNGYGANLIYDEKKIIDKDLTIQEGGLKLLNYGPFQDAYEELLKLLKKRKIPLDTPIKKLPKDFFLLLEDGQGNYPGYAELKRYLESKKYKPSVRIYIRNLQREEPCLVCHSSRLNKNIHHYKMKLRGELWGLEEVMGLTLEEAYPLFKETRALASSHEKRLFSDIFEKLKMGREMGLNHLSLLRKAKTLSAGEYQRLLLIKYLSFKGTDSLFVLDEPSIGLASGELEKLIEGLRQIIEQGNTVILIDHSEQIQKASDHLIVMGPGSGKNGGDVIYEGNPSEYFKNKEKVSWEKRKSSNKYPQFIEVSEPEIYGKQYPDFKIPINELTWVTGPSGTGKTATLIKVMANVIHQKIYGDWLEDDDIYYKSVKSASKFDDVIVVSSDLNRFTSRSSVGTITELGSVIRKHFLKLPIAKSMNLKEGHLSSNSELGMCPRCEGRGSIVIEMQYLEDIVLECEDCKGLKIRPLYANISDGKMTVAEAYNLPLGQVLERINLTPKFRRVWEYLKILNLDYLSLDRGLNTLSGGEKQRIFLLSKLLKNIQNSLLVFENISFGLSEKELNMLGTFLQDLVQLKNTIVIIDASNCFKYLASWQLQFDTKGTYLLPINKV